MNTAQNPARKGSVIQVYATGEGVTTPQGVDGRINSGEVLPSPVQGVSATIDGQNAGVQYKGAAPSAISGLFQVNLFVPLNVRSGPVPIQIRVGTVTSPAGVTVFIE